MDVNKSELQFFSKDEALKKLVDVFAFFKGRKLMMKYFFTLLVGLLVFNLHGEIIAKVNSDIPNRTNNLAFYKDDKDNPVIVVDEYFNIFSVDGEITEHNAFCFYSIPEDSGFLHYIKLEDGFISISATELNKYILCRIARTICKNNKNRTKIIDGIHSIYKLDNTGFFLYVKGITSKGSSMVYNNITESPQELIPKEISSEQLEKYTKLLFEHIKTSKTPKKIDLLSSIDLASSVNLSSSDDYVNSLYQHSEYVFSIHNDRKKTKFLLDFSGSQDICKIECFQNNKLTQQVIYYNAYNVSAISFNRLADKKTILHLNRQDIDDITVEYVLVDKERIFLYSPKINLSNMEFE